MRILIASQYHLSAFRGGNEHYAHELADALANLGHEVYYLTTKALKNHDSYHIHSVPAPNPFGYSLPSLNWVKTASRLKPDIIHTCGSGMVLHSTTLILNSVPTVHTFQGALHPKSLLNRLGAKIETTLINKTYPAIITTSPYFKQKLSQVWPHKDITFIPLMVSRKFLHVGPKKNSREKLLLSPKLKYVLFVAKLDKHHYYKGLDILLGSLAYVPSNYRFLIVGGGELLPHYQKQTVDPRINFLGDVADDELVHYYNAADIFVLPSTSDSEGFGLVILEAMAAHTTVVTTTAVASASWFNRHTKLNLVPPNHPKKLALAITKNITNTDENALKTNAAFAKKHTAEKMALETLSFYKKIISS